MGAIKVNSTDVAKVYVGGTEVSKIFAGSVLVWENGGPTPPPVGYTNKIYGHTRSASQTLTIKVNGVSHSVTSTAGKYFELDCTGTEITSLAQCLYNQANLNDVVFDIDTSRCTDFSQMLANSRYGSGVYDCSRLDMRSAKSVSSMFYLCSLASLALPQWSHNGLTSTQFMFYSCSAAASISLVGLGNLSGVSGANGMFQSCSSLAEIDMSYVTSFNPGNRNNFFAGCSSLSTIKVEGCDATTIDFLLARLGDAGFTFTKQGDYLIKN